MPANTNGNTFGTVSLDERLAWWLLEDPNVGGTSDGHTVVAQDATTVTIRGPDGTETTIGRPAPASAGAGAPPLASTDPRRAVCHAIRVFASGAHIGTLGASDANLHPTDDLIGSAAGAVAQGNLMVAAAYIEQVYNLLLDALNKGCTLVYWTNGGNYILYRVPIQGNAAELARELHAGNPVFMAVRTQLLELVCTGELVTEIHIGADSADLITREQRIQATTFSGACTELYNHLHRFADRENPVYGQLMPILAEMVGPGTFLHMDEDDGAMEAEAAEGAGTPPSAIPAALLGAEGGFALPPRVSATGGLSRQITATTASNAAATAAAAAAGAPMNPRALAFQAAVEQDRERDRQMHEEDARREYREEQFQHLRDQIADLRRYRTKCEMELAAAKAAVAAAQQAGAGADAVLEGGNLMDHPGFREHLRLIQAQNRLMEAQQHLDRLHPLEQRLVRLRRRNFEDDEDDEDDEDAEVPENAEEGVTGAAMSVSVVDLRAVVPNPDPAAEAASTEAAQAALKMEENEDA